MAVRGYEGSTLTLDDLWRVFSCYGEVASVIIEPGHRHLPRPVQLPRAGARHGAGAGVRGAARARVPPPGLAAGGGGVAAAAPLPPSDPAPLLPALAPAQPALRRRHPRRGEALARAPLQPQRAPAPCRRHGHGQGGRRRDLRGRSAGRGLGLRQDDTRLLVLGSSEIFRGREEEDGKQSRGGMAAGKYLWMVWHLHCWNFSDTDYFVKHEMLNTESMISILLQIALVRSQQEMV